MIDIIYDNKIITQNALTQPGFIEKVERTIQLLEKDRRIGELYDIVMNIGKALALSKEFFIDYPDLYKRYSLITLKAKYHCFLFISQKEVFELINKNLLLAFRSGIDIIQLSRDRFNLYYDDLDQVERYNILKALITNEEKLGSDYIEPADKTNRNPPSIRNWILDYIRFSSSNKLLSNVDEIFYINHNQNVKKLTPQDKELLLQVLKFYDYLHFPETYKEVVATEHRVEEREPVRAVYQEPVTTSLAQAFRDYEKLHDQILKKEDELMVKTKGNVDQIKRQLSQAARSSDKNTLVACLKILARDGSLKAVLRDHPAWFEAVAESMRKKYNNVYGKDIVENMISTEKLNPTSSFLLSEFLQYLLKERVQMNENDSALVGLDLGQTMEAERQRLAYGNQETGQFEWVKNKIENGRLVSEL